MLIPIRDNNPTQRFAIFNYTFIAINVAIYFYQISLEPRQHYYFLLAYGAIPAKISALSNLGSLFTSMFLHGGLFHLLGNMLYLYIFGDNIEDLLGRFRYVLFYLASGLAAALTHVLVAPHSTLPMVGASGAISGILGAYLVNYPGARVLVAIPIFFYYRVFWVPSIVVLGIWFVMQLAFGLLSLGADGGSGVAWFAHIGGFVFGMLFIKLMAPRPRGVADEYDDLDENDYYR